MLRQGHSQTSVACVSRCCPETSHAELILSSSLRLCLVELALCAAVPNCFGKITRVARVCPPQTGCTLTKVTIADPGPP